jgi:type IV pilus assembly protein PilB
MINWPFLLLVVVVSSFIGALVGISVILWSTHNKAQDVLDLVVEDKQEPSEHKPDKNVLELEVENKEEPSEEKPDKNEDEAAIVRFVNKMLHDALKMGASDLHFEPYEKFYRVRFRLHGVLRVVANPPISISRQLAARFKVMARLDVAERRVPQEGYVKLKLPGNKAIGFQISTCPTLWGEKVVVSILESPTVQLNLDTLGFEPEQKRLYLEALANPEGLILVTGPVYSGKKTTLYTGISFLNKESVNISTIEKNVNIQLPGINQVQIEERIGQNFPWAFRIFLKQSSDIILMDEIVDEIQQPISIAIRAASRGCLVMSTLHTNDEAPQALTRLLDMGVSPFAVAHSVKFVIAQRLCRRLCRCKVEQEIPESVLLAEGFEKIPELKLYGPQINGCEECDRTGYKGRIGLYQVMPISEQMKRLIMQGSNAIELAEQARREGISDLREAGLKKVKDGITSLEEVNRVVHN